MAREQNLGVCEHCAKKFSYSLFHNGFGDSAYGYCDRCSYTVILSGWTKTPADAKLKIQAPITKEIESFLKACPCGGAFRAPGGPRCPHCSQELSAILATTYIEANAPGTKKGWRWDQRWDGIYGIVIEDRAVNDWWI
jgi:hypothetical protein